MENHSITFGTQAIAFELHRKNVKWININTRPDLTVMVSAREAVPISFIKTVIKRKAPRILKNISYFQNVKSEKDGHKAYVSGESFNYLGKQIRCKVEASDAERAYCKSGYLYLSLKDKNNLQKKQQIFNAWIRKRAAIIFEQSLDKIFSRVESYGVKKPSVMIRQMKTRWGSCVKSKNTILLNSQLIKAPKYCIEYVILHELIHFIHRNHDGEFFRLLTALMPDWKERKQILDQEIVSFALT